MAAVANKQFWDILLLGKTGQGKSTTGNKLLGLSVNGDGSVPSAAASSLDLKEWPMPELTATGRGRDLSGVTTEHKTLSSTAELSRSGLNQPGDPPSIKPDVPVIVANETVQTGPPGAIDGNTPASTSITDKIGNAQALQHPAQPRQSIADSDHVPDSRERTEEDIYFPVGVDELSTTVLPRLLSSGSTMKRVLDTPGFSQSGSKLPVIQANLQLMRQIAFIQRNCGLAFRYVLYFLPYRGPPHKADRVLKDEIAIMHHYFGESIWRRLLFVLTAPHVPEMQYDLSSSLTDGNLRAAAVHVIMEALEDVWKSYNYKKTSFECPKFIYISADETSETTISKIDGIATEDAGGLQLRFDECIKCSALIGLNCEPDGDVVIDIPTTATLKNGKVVHKCHPQFTRKREKSGCVICGNMRKQGEGCVSIGSLYDGWEVNHETTLSIETLLH